MGPTRRHFLQSAVLSALAVNFPLSAFAQKLLNRSGRDFDPETLVIFNGISPQTFEPWIGSRFRMSLNNKPQGSLVLLSVDNAGPEASTETKEEPYRANTVSRSGPVPRLSNEPVITTFALHFQRTGNALPQGTYMLSHDWLGTFPLLLVPSGLSEAQSTCTAIFSLLNQIRPKPLN